MSTMVNVLWKDKDAIHDLNHTKMEMVKHTNPASELSILLRLYPEDTIYNKNKTKRNPNQTKSKQKKT